MSDDLVKRLRDQTILERFENGYVSQIRNPDGPKAADRIETLEAALRDIIEQGDDDFPSPKDMIWTARKALEGKDG